MGEDFRSRGKSLLMLGAGLVGCAVMTVQPATSTIFEQVDLEQSGDSGVHTYRIPAMVVVNDGAVIIAFDARNNSSGDLPGDIDVMVRRSTDLGRTWSAARRVVDFGDGFGGGDPSLLVDRETGRIFMFYAYSPPGVGLANANGDRDPRSLKTLHPHLIWSDDGGMSWSGPRNLIVEIKPETARGMFAASGHGIQLSANSPAPGRLLQPFAWLDESGEMHAGNAYSDDHGTTWQMGKSIGTGLDENKAVELADGRVMQNSRANRRGQNYRWIAYSTDGGMSHGAPMPEHDLVDPRNNADIIRAYPNALPGSAEARMLLFSNTADANERVDLTVRLSCDSGQSWPVAKVLHAGPAMYSTMARLADGSFAILYENGTDGGLTFARFNLAWLGGSC